MNNVILNHQIVIYKVSSIGIISYYTSHFSCSKNIFWLVVSSKHFLQQPDHVSLDVLRTRLLYHLLLEGLPDFLQVRCQLSKSLNLCSLLQLIQLQAKYKPSKQPVYHSHRP
jgi:hypothetical protein